MTVYSGFGTTLGKGDAASPEVFTAVAQVVDIAGPSMSADTIDITNHSSTNGYREFIQGLKDGGEVTMTVQYDPAAATHKNSSGGVLYVFEQGSKGNWKITFPSSPSASWTFPAVITGFDLKTPLNDQMVADVTFKVAGKPTLA